jgi:hypothetical protein
MNFLWHLVDALRVEIVFYVLAKSVVCSGNECDYTSITL